MAEKDVEAVRSAKIPFFRQVFDQAGITPEVQKCEYEGSGTEDDPYVVSWLEDGTYIDGQTFPVSTTTANPLALRYKTLGIRCCMARSGSGPSL